MRLPRGQDAIIPKGKVETYCLAPQHKDGRHKAAVFASALGLTLGDAAVLTAALLTAARECEAELLFEDHNGARYRVDFRMTHGGRSRLVRSGWTVRAPGGPPYLSTAFVIPSSHD